MHDVSSYPGEELVLFEKAVKWKRYFASFIKPYLNGAIIESGAGTGGTTLLLNDGSAPSWILLEPDNTMADLLEKKVEYLQFPDNCKVIRGTTAQLSGITADTIIYIDVLEHIEQDKQELEKAATLLKQRGHLIILSPAFQSLYSPFDKAIGHYRRYTKATLKQVVPGSLTQVQLRYLDSTGYFMSLANRLLLKQNYPTAKQIEIWDNYIIPVSRVTDRVLNYSFGRSILGAWRKN
jgi:ubiquinone/menaquinone biosynthesis C-methylase UbiE